MSKKSRSRVSKEFIRACRYEMVLEMLQLVLTDAGWFKEELAQYLAITYDELNQLLCRQNYPASSRLMRQARKLYQQKYGQSLPLILNKNRRLTYLNQAIYDDTINQQPDDQ